MYQQIMRIGIQYMSASIDERTVLNLLSTLSSTSSYISIHYNQICVDILSGTISNLIKKYGGT